VLDPEHMSDGVATLAQSPFVAVNCGALPADLLDSQMFGHVRGAFTGAIHDRLGRFDLASAGTLFPDEAGDLPLRKLPEFVHVACGTAAVCCAGREDTSS
jgi:transcriptional regulator with GAF, ATPase, and Fis domain